MTIDEVYDYVRNQHPYKLLDLNGTSGYTNFTINIPYDTIADIQQGHIFFVESNTSITTNIGNIDVYALDGGHLSTTILGNCEPGRIYAFEFNTNNNVVLLPFHDESIEAKVLEMYEGLHSRIVGAFTEDANDAGLTLNSNYNSKLTLQTLVSELLIQAESVEAVEITAEKIVIPAPLDADNPTFIYGDDASGVVTYDGLDLVIDSKITDALEDKIKIDSRTPEAYELDTGEELADGTLYFQVSESN